MMLAGEMQGKLVQTTNRLFADLHRLWIVDESPVLDGLSKSPLNMLSDKRLQLRTALSTYVHTLSIASPFLLTAVLNTSS